MLLEAFYFIWSILNVSFLQILVSETELEDIDRIDNRFSLGELYTLWPDVCYILYNVLGVLS